MPTRNSLPNVVTGLRLAAVPVLWLFAFAGREGVVGAGLVLAWVTDALDGLLARRLRAFSRWGSRFDSVTDTLLFVSTLAWVALLRPGFVREHALLLGLWLALGAAAYLVGWIRFRRVADLHLYSAKAANFAGLLFAAWLLGVGSYPAPVFYVVYGICVLAALEMLAAVARLERVDEHIVSVFRSPRGRDLHPSRTPSEK